MTPKTLPDSALEAPRKLLTACAHVRRESRDVVIPQTTMKSARTDMELS
jgi:hypothetical protein